MIYRPAKHIGGTIGMEFDALWQALQRVQVIGATQTTRGTVLRPAAGTVGAANLPSFVGPPVLVSGNIQVTVSGSYDEALWFKNGALIKTETSPPAGGLLSMPAPAPAAGIYHVIIRSPLNIPIWSKQLTLS
jgi:hypothetical protein